MSRHLRGDPTDGAAGIGPPIPGQTVGTTFSQSCHIQDGHTSSRSDSPGPHSFRRTVIGCTALNPSVNAVRFIRGCDGDVQIDALHRRVTKTYLHPQSDIAIGNARREVNYAARFHRALADIRGITCPRIVACDLSMPPRVVMAQCPGTPLLGFLGRVDAQDPRIPLISGRIRLGLEVYTHLFEEPYYDFCFNNMLFDEDSGTVAFLDFVIPQGSPDAGEATPIEASLGWLVGCACYELVRPAFLASSSKATHLELMHSVVSEFDGRVRIDRVCARAKDALSQMWDTGGHLRRKYYRTIGSFVTRGFLRRLTREAVAR